MDPDRRRVFDPLACELGRAGDPLEGGKQFAEAATLSGGLNRPEARCEAMPGKELLSGLIGCSFSPRQIEVAAIPVLRDRPERWNRQYRALGHAVAGTPGTGSALGVKSWNDAHA